MMNCTGKAKEKTTRNANYARTAGDHPAEREICALSSEHNGREKAVVARKEGRTTQIVELVAHPTIPGPNPLWSMAYKFSIGLLSKKD